MTTLTNNKVTLSNLNARINSNMTCTVAVTLMVSDAKRLNDIFNILTNVSGVYSVGRVIH
jgi:(p)ppGpp synthase/HD superfamily hydrolase